jgi:hypothetical protein
MALTLAISAPGLVAPAAGVSARHATHGFAVGLRDGHGSAKKPKKAKKATGNPWSKKDIAEIALLALSPFAVMGLLMFASGYRRGRRASPDRPRTSPPPEA